LALELRLLALHEGRFGIDQLTIEASIEGSISTGEASLEGAILKPGAEAGPRGTIRRRYLPSRNYAAEVVNAGLRLPEPYQGRGFTTELSLQVEDGYRTENIRFVRLIAGREVGGLVWAASFDFDDSRLRGFGVPTAKGSGVGIGGEHVRLPSRGSRLELRRLLVRSIADAAVASARITQHERHELEPYLPELVTPALVKAFRLPGDQVLGKRLLEGSRWPGLKDLAPPEAR
jgi:hypothetical protein